MTQTQHAWTTFLTSNDALLSDRECHFDDSPRFATMGQISGKTWLKSLSVINIEGADSHKFLHSQLSCDMNLISETQSLIGTHNSLKGRMLSSFRIVKYSDEQFKLIIDQSIQASCIEQLQKYAVFSKVTISADDDYVCLGIFAAHNSDELEASSENIGERGVSQSELGAWIQVDQSANRHLLLCSTQQAQTIWSTSESVSNLSSPLWTCADIEQGLAWVQASTTDEHLPQSFNYQTMDGVSFKKGCYIGQEIIIRVQHQGTLKKHLYTLTCNDAKTLASAGSGIVDSVSKKKQGEIVAAADFGDNTIKYLAVLNEKSFSEGLDLEAEENGQAISQVRLSLKPE